MNRVALVLCLVGSVTAAADKLPDPPAPDGTSPPDATTAPVVAPNAQPAGSDPAPDVTAPPPSAAKPAQTVQYKIEPLSRRGIAPDLTVATGVRVWQGDHDTVRRFMGKIRAGVTMYNEPNFLLVGVTGQINTLGSSSLGVEAAVLNMVSGIWGQAEIMPLDSKSGIIGGVSFGYALFGLEYQRRLTGDLRDQQSMTLMINVPLGAIRVATQ